MKVINILAILHPRYGGPAYSVPSMCGRLSHQIDCRIWGTATEEEKKTLLSNNNLRAFPRKSPYAWYRCSGLYEALLDEKGIDLLHLRMLWDYPVLIGSKFGLKQKIPYLLSPHGTLTHKWRYMEIKKRAYLAIFGRQILNNARCIHVTSKLEYDGCREAGITVPISIIPNGVEIFDVDENLCSEAFETNFKHLKDRKIILYIGRLSPEKGLDILISSWAAISKHNPDAILIIAGPDDRGYKNEVIRMIDKHGLKNQVELVGFVNAMLKRSLLSRAWCLVLPSYSENFGITVAEALAAGCPAITTTGTPWQELETEQAGYYARPELDEMAKALSKCLKLPVNSRNQMGQHGKQLIITKYNWETVSKKMLTLYKCILDNKEIPMYPD